MCIRDRDKINAAYAYGGLELTQQTVSDFLGIKLDRYAIIDFKSLVSLVDAVGGLEIDVPVRMYVPLEGIDLQPGLQHLNGEQVLALSLIHIYRHSYRARKRLFGGNVQSVEFGYSR